MLLQARVWSQRPPQLWGASHLSVLGLSCMARVGVLARNQGESASLIRVVRSWSHLAEGTLSYLRGWFMYLVSCVRVVMMPMLLGATYLLAAVALVGLWDVCIWLPALGTAP